MHDRTGSYPAKSIVPSLVLLAASLTSCSLLLEAEDTQCSTSADCNARGLSNAACVDGLCLSTSSSSDAGEDADDGSTADDVEQPDADPIWGCVGNISWPDPDPNVQVQMRRRVLRLIGETPVAGLTLIACSPLDIECSEPLTQGTTDDNGDVVLSVFSGFDGYLLGESPSTYPEMIPALVFGFPPPSQSDPVGVGEPLHFTGTNEANLMAAVLQLEIKPELGHIFALAVDCQGKPVSGVSLKLDTVSTDTVAYYMNGSLPSRTLSETAVAGEAGFINAPPGFVTITTTVSGVGRVSALTVLVRPGHITYVPLAPSP